MNGRPYVKQSVGDTSWMQKGNCHGVDPDLMHPAVGDTQAAEAARAVCVGCPVKGPCLDYALANREHQGIWGGLTDKERRKEAKRRRQLGLLPRRLDATTPLIHGNGTGAYNRCRALNGDACAVCLAGHAAVQREAKALRKERRAS